METLAYIHLATTAQSPEDLELIIHPFDLRWAEALNWKKLPSSAWIGLGAIAISLALLGIASSSALALTRGNQGSQVITLQQKLKTTGYFNGPVTGFYGPQTQAAVRGFQQAKGLPVDGIAGSKTLSVLYGTSNNGSSVPTGILLRRGNRSTAVSQLQNTLKTKGIFNGPVTGYYGNQTEAAVRNFQRSKGLRVDGIAGPNTLVALNGTSVNNPLPTPITGTELRYGDSGTAVSQLQNRLKTLGFYKYEVSGYYGRLTETAVSDFQRSRKLSINGIAGPTTLAALQNNPPSNSIGTTLRRGSQGTAVAQLQNRLKALGLFRGSATGYYGEVTETAVRNFQRSRGISVNGIAGPTTLAALQGTNPNNGRIDVAKELRYGDRGTAVAQLQNQLKSKGFFQANVTGYYGPLTEQAVKDFQRSRGISVNGIAGSTTLAALQGVSPGGNSTAIASLR